MIKKFFLEKQLTYKYTKLACYIGIACIGIVDNFPPLLFLTFQETWAISLGQITFLISLNFFAQLIAGISLVKLVEKIPYRHLAIGSTVMMFFGLVFMVLLPQIFPIPYLGLCIATALNGFSVGIIDIVLNSVLEGLPGDNKFSSMSLLHSFYCWISVAVILFSTLIFKIYSAKVWPLLTLLFAVLPVICFFLFLRVPINPLVKKDTKRTPVNQLMRNGVFYILLISMFAAGASKTAISQWSPYFAEVALSVPKATGDIFGLAFFLLTMAITRTIIGSIRVRLKLEKLLSLAATICIICCIVIALSHSAIGSLLAIGVSGFAVGVFLAKYIKFSKRIVSKIGC